MTSQTYREYLNILHRELVPALGCTEPIAIAYAAAKARETLGEMPDRAVANCSGNIIKNVKSVTVPNSGGKVGVEIAATLGIVGGNAAQVLEVLSGITQAHRDLTNELMEQDFCVCTLQEGVDNLYVDITVWAGEHSARVVVTEKHTHIERIEKDGELLFMDKIQEDAGEEPDAQLSVKQIVEFANAVELADIEDLIERQISMNTAIAAEGLQNTYGAAIGRTLLEHFGTSVSIRAMAAAAAGSDARMGGCPLPVVINSGSGNQGMTVSLPVIEFAKELGSSKEELYRAMVISNLISVHIKKNIGDLSAFCGAVSAACGAGAAITYLHRGTLVQIANTLINTVANVGGILCDGAKASCAAKIASSVQAALLGHAMSMQGVVFQNDDGLVLDDVEKTIRSIGHVGREGMKQTDLEILKVMLKEISF